MWNINIEYYKKKMVQPIKNRVNKTRKEKIKRKKGHKEYGTSKLEERFAREFLDKLGVKYTYQFKAESIGRYFDFYLQDEHLIIEIDGDYWHSKDVIYEDMTPTQKKNKRVDKLKDHWALINGYPILRIWESDINKNPEKVMKLLKDKLFLAKKSRMLDINKKNRSFYRKNDN